MWTYPLLDLILNILGTIAVLFLGLGSLSVPRIADKEGVLIGFLLVIASILAIITIWV